MRDHPRIRGEHSMYSNLRTAARGSSPHTRGAPSVSRENRRPRRIIPAYAGSTLETNVNKTVAQGSSPHTRGAPRARRERELRSRIIPAYAGSTGTFRISSWRPGDHPRIRGEHLYGAGRLVIGGGSSPHTRGAPQFRSCCRRRRRIIPAYAGSTARRASMTAYRRDHPRIRGEHR